VLYSATSPVRRRTGPPTVAFPGAEDGMDEVIRRFSQEVFTIHLSGRFILFVIFLGIAGFLRRLYISGGKDWQKVFIATAPSLKEGPSPIDTVLKGTIGCLKAIIALFLVIICIILAIDAIALNSEILIQILNQLP
jgi:hypothetical protein